MSQAVETPMRAYTFMGRVHPERYNYSMHPLPMLTYASDDGFKVTYRFQLFSSQMSIGVEINREIPLLDLKNTVSSMASAALDSLGFIFSSALSLEVISCVDPSGQWHVFDTVFDGFREEGEG